MNILINNIPHKVIPYGYCACGCGEKVNIKKRRKYVLRHYMKVSTNAPRWNGGRKLSNGYVLILVPGHPRSDVDGYVREHILIAEKALGKPLPPKAIVHHHTPKQLVIGQNQAYHMLLHKRQRSLESCGHANWLKCPFCKQYDDPQNMVVRLKNGRSGEKGAWIQAEHRACRAEHDKNRKAERRASCQYQR